MAETGRALWIHLAHPLLQQDHPEQGAKPPPGGSEDSDVFCSGSLSAVGSAKWHQSID